MNKKTLVIISIIAGFLVVCIIFYLLFPNLNQFSGVGKIIGGTTKANPPIEETKFMPSYELEFATNLADMSFIRFTSEIKFKEITGVQEMAHKAKRVKYALSLSLRHLKYPQIEGANQYKVQMILNDILDSVLRYKASHVYITKFYLREPQS